MSERGDTAPGLRKAATGIAGLDQITFGGLPAGRPTLVCGGAGCGKTLFAVKFLVHGATECGERGVFLTFEETADELVQNFASVGFDLAALVAQGQLRIDHVHLDDAPAAVAGTFDLEGLFIRLGHAIERTGAKRVVLDNVESLFASLSHEALLRAEFRRLFHWLKEKGVTAVVTAERGTQSLTRHGIEEYVSDCVIELSHRVNGQMTTRGVRVVKYRGSPHGTNEYPFLIDERGIRVLPITSAGLAHVASRECVPSGIAALDRMLAGGGYFRGSSVLVSGTAGCGKTSVAAHFLDAACRRGERCLAFLFEESPSQLVRNMSSLGFDLQQWVDRGLLRFHAARPSLHGLEMHLAIMQHHVEAFDPQLIVIDPISSFGTLGSLLEIRAMLVRMVDFLKSRNITAFVTSLTNPGGGLEHTEQEISSLIDTWLLLRDIEANGERTRGLYILKSRGMAHSKQIREFVLTDHGVELVDVYAGPGGVLTGTARLAQEAKEAAEALAAGQNIERQRLALERKRAALESRIAALRAEFDADAAEAQRAITQGEASVRTAQGERAAMKEKREGLAVEGGGPP
ncbi:MAG: circadian clock protein KaiC [Burkholderiales bacterium]